VEDSACDSEAETVKMQSVLGDSSSSVLGQQARRMTSVTGERLPPSTCSLTADEICKIIRDRRRASGAVDTPRPRTFPITGEAVRAELRDLHRRAMLQRGFLPGGIARTVSREAVRSRLDDEQTETGIPLDYQRVAGEQPLSEMMLSDQRNNPVAWQRLDSDINPRRPVPIESIVSIGPLRRGEEDIRGRQCGDNRLVRASNNNEIPLHQGDVGHSSVRPQSSFSPLEGYQRQSMQLRECERSSVNRQCHVTAARFVLIATARPPPSMSKHSE